MKKFKLQNTDDNPISIVTETKYYGYDGAYDLYVCAYQLEPLEEYNSRVKENDRKIKEKMEKDILSVQKKLKTLENFNYN